VVVVVKELTEEGRPFLLLFYHPDHSAAVIKEAFHRQVALQLLDLKRTYTQRFVIIRPPVCSPPLKSLITISARMLNKGRKRTHLVGLLSEHETIPMAFPGPGLLQAGPLFRKNVGAPNI